MSSGSPSPSVVFLPSSGGSVNSRIGPDLITRRTFPFRRYSVGEDGSLSVKVKQPNHDGCYHPYTKPAARFNATPVHRLSPSLDPNHTTSDPDRRITAETLGGLVVGDSVGLEAVYELNKSVIAALTQAKEQRSRRPLERTQIQTSDRSFSKVPSSTSTTLLIPFKHERSFPSGHRGVTTWFTTQSYSDVTELPRGLPAVAGHLYIHKNISSSARQVWVCGRDARWSPVPSNAKTVHPTLLDRVLSFRSDGTPNWVTSVGFATTKTRRAKDLET